MTKTKKTEKRYPKAMIICYPFPLFFNFLNRSLGFCCEIMAPGSIKYIYIDNEEESVLLAIVR